MTFFRSFFYIFIRNTFSVNILLTNKNVCGNFNLEVLYLNFHEDVIPMEQLDII